MDISWLKQCFGVDWRTDLMLGALIVTTAVVLRILWRVQRTLNDIDFADWLRGPDGKASWKQASGIAGFMVGSWCMIYTTLTGHVPEGYVLLFLVYFAICIGNPLAVSLFNAMRGGALPVVQPNQQVRVDAPADASVTVQSGPQGGQQ